jgi:hypothetical protein
MQGFLAGIFWRSDFFGNLDPAFVSVSSELAARILSRVGIFLAC